MKNKNLYLILFTILLSPIIGQNGLIFAQGVDYKSVKNKTYDISSLEWNLWGYRPESWKMDFETLPDLKVIKPNTSTFRYKCRAPCKKH